MGRRILELLANAFSDRDDSDRFHEDFVRLQKKGGQAPLQRGVAAEYEYHCVGVGVKQGVDDDEDIRGVWRVQVVEEYIKLFRSDETQRRGYARCDDHVKPVVFQAFLEHGANFIIVVY